MKRNILPKEVYPLLVLVGSTCLGSIAFSFKSIMKPDVYIDKNKRFSIFK